MNNIKGTTRVCGLIGNPVGHSISPLIHNTLAESCKLDMAYVTFKVEENQVDNAVLGAYALNLLGMNVTVPYKQAVISSLADIDPIAKAIGAVNTLVRTDNGFKGYNTDIIGLDRELSDVGINLENQKVIILGAGGAARAIAFLCADKGASVIYLLNRTVAKAELIADDVNAHFNSRCVIPLAIDEYNSILGDDYITIQTSSVGLYPECNRALIEDEAFYKKVKAGVDIIYNPAKTQFMKLVEQQGKCAYNGLKMLLYQGVSA
ncbi:MAG: shikimate dehydrogenase, partial [Eubacteriales bacterium]|nr:shikimate dehydrogenase [Eubacteriales bacterium]